MKGIDLNLLYKDIYFEPAYGKLCETIEKGVAEIFRLETTDGIISNMFLKKHLPVDLDPEQKYLDISTPYGYGGPIILELDGNKTKLVAEYDRKFSEYCIDNNIICEFIRFHPIIRNDLDFKEIYTTIFSRHTVSTNLIGINDPLTEQFSRSTRKNIRKALESGATVEVIEKPGNLDNFTKIYYETMDRNIARDFYYFPKEYFDMICEKFYDSIINVNVYKDNFCIASGVYFHYDKIMQIHLSGTLDDYLYLSPAYLLRYAAIKWAKEHNIEIVHHGGGTTNDKNDSLLLFKQRFSKDPLSDFYIGKKIYNKEIYTAMVNKSKKEESTYFPQYRG